MIKYLIPFYYTLHTRTKSLSQKISYLFIFIFPIIIYLAEFSKNNLLIILLGFIILISIYEIGYIYNDVFTIKKETHPTLRLTQEEILYLEKNYKIIAILKHIVAILPLIIIVKSVQASVYSFIIILISIEFIYYFHNRTRGKLSLLTYFLLVTLRYSALPCLVFGIDASIISDWILIISLQNLLIKLSKSKFYSKNKILKLIKENIDFFRVIYYLILFSLNTNIMLKTTLLYFLVYRLGIFFILLFRNIIKNRIKLGGQL